ncbi:MAG: NAD(P)H-hydrate dehydratase [Sphingobium sp.]
MTLPLIDHDWLAAHPLPSLDSVEDKNSRGRVLVAGGAEFVPGALRLTGEAALRAGAGKLQMATVRSAAMALGVLVPEAAMIALPADEDGEIAAEAAAVLAKRVERCDCLILGPGMSAGDRTDQLVADLLARADGCRTIVLDAAAITSARELAPVIRQHEGRVILTPHHGEMAQLSGLDVAEIAADPARVAADMAARFGAVILLKGRESVLVGADGEVLLHTGGCVGLATGGSGDVLAGIIGGLAARGASPFVAAGWGAWLHGRAGETLAETFGPVGFLARELLPIIPRLLDKAVTISREARVGF